MATVSQVQASGAVTEPTHLDPALTSVNAGGPFLMPLPLCGSLSQPGAISRHALPATVNSSRGGGGEGGREEEGGRGGEGRHKEQSLFHAVICLPRS